MSAGIAESTTSVAPRPGVLLFVVNVDWFFVSHRLPLAMAALRRGFEVHVATRFDPAEKRRLEALGLICHHVPFRRGGDRWMRMSAEVRSLWQVLREVTPDVVHLVTIKPILIGGILARLRGSPGVILAVPGRGPVFTARGLRAALRRRAALLAYRFAYAPGRCRVIFQNEDDREYFLSRGIFAAADTCLIRGSGVDTGDVHPVPEPPGMPVVVFAARMIREKGAADFVAAARLLRARGSTARFVLAGDIDTGNPDCHSRADLESWVAEGAVEWVGFCRDVPALFAQSHLVCLPTYYGEGLPKVLLEAAACARAVVASDVPGCRDIVRQGVTGLLVPPRDPPALAEAIAALLDDAPRRVQMGLAGRRLVEQQFSLEKVVGQTMRIYEELACARA